MRKNKQPLTYTRDEILNLFLYDKEKGVLYRKVKIKNYKEDYIGSHGRNIKKGYIKTCINKIPVHVHRMIYFLETGKWPEMIDHINGIKTDNRFSNLREVCSRENQQNQYKHRNGKLVGAIKDKRFKNTWYAQIVVSGKKKHLGTFKTELEAHNVYMEAARQYLKSRGGDK